MAEQRMPSRPKQLLDSALRVVKGDQTMQLVEQFTSEMTLVAEGLADDQARLHNALDEARKEQERDRQRLESSIEALENSLLENQRETDRRLEAMTKRLDSLEQQLTAKPAKPEKHKSEGILKQATLLVSILCGSWVLVTLLNLLH